MGAPATLPANFQGWDTASNPPQSLPANFNQWDQQSADSGQATSDDEASRTRQMLVSGLTGLASPVMTDQEKQQFEQGKAAGAISVPAVAAVTAGATALPEVAPSLLQRAQTVYTWAKANPLKAGAVEAIARELGIDPFQLAHKAVKYGKELFGGDEK